MISNEGLGSNYYAWKQTRKEVEAKIKGGWIQDKLPFNDTVAGSKDYNPKTHEHSTKEEFYSYISKANILTKTEFEDLFWNHLVKIGWKMQDDHVIALVCQECDSVLFSIAIKSIDQSPETKTAYLKNPINHKQKHEKVCVPTEKPL